MTTPNLTVSLLHYINDADGDLLSLGMSKGVKPFEKVLETICQDIFQSIDPDIILSNLRDNADIQKVLLTRLKAEADSLRSQNASGQGWFWQSSHLIGAILISFIVMILFAIVAICNIFGHTVDSRLFDILQFGFTSVIGFWLGSSVGSFAKSSVIADIAKS